MRICQNCTYHALVVMQMGNILLWDGTKHTQNAWIGNKYTINMRICQNCTYHALVVMQMATSYHEIVQKTHKILELVTNTQ